MPVALVVTVSPRLPGLLGPAGWRAVRAAGRWPPCRVPRVPRPRCAPTDWRSRTCPDAAAAAARPDDVVLLAARGGAGPGAEVWTAPPSRPAPPARRRRGDGPAALPGRLPLGRRADALLAARLPAGGGARGLRRDRRRRPGGDARGARRRAAAGRLPRPRGRRGGARTAGSTSTAWPATWSTSWSAGTRTSSATPGPRDVAQVEAGWEEIKQAEKQRRSPTEGVSRSQPAAAWGAALVRRAGRAGLPTPDAADLTVDSPEALGERLLAVVAAAEQRGWDVEDALREAVRRYAGELDAEAGPRPPDDARLHAVGCRTRRGGERGGVPT